MLKKRFGHCDERNAGGQRVRAQCRPRKPTSLQRHAPDWALRPWPSCAPVSITVDLTASPWLVRNGGADSLGARVASYILGCSGRVARLLHCGGSTA